MSMQIVSDSYFEYFFVKWKYSPYSKALYGKDKKVSKKKKTA